MSARFLVLSALLAIAGCGISSTELHTEVVLPKATVPVSMSMYLVDHDGSVVVPKMYRKVGAFSHKTESCDGATVDLSDAINKQVAAAGGNAIVNFTVHANSAGCTDLELRGDIVAVSGGGAQ